MAKENKEKKTLDILDNSGVKIKCRDGKEYTFTAFTLKEAFEFAEILDSGFNMDMPFINVLDEDSREKMLDALELAFKANYKDITKEQIIEIVDLKIAREIIYTCIDINEFMEKAKKEKN